MTDEQIARTERFLRYSHGRVHFCYKTFTELAEENKRLIEMKSSNIVKKTPSRKNKFEVVGENLA